MALESTQMTAGVAIEAIDEFDPTFQKYAEGIKNLTLVTNEASAAAQESATAAATEAVAQKEATVAVKENAEAHAMGERAMVRYFLAANVLTGGLESLGLSHSQLHTASMLAFTAMMAGTNVMMWALVAAGALAVGIVKVVNAEKELREARDASIDALATASAKTHDLSDKLRQLVEMRREETLAEIAATRAQIDAMQLNGIHLGVMERMHLWWEKLTIDVKTYAAVAETPQNAKWIIQQGEAEKKALDVSAATAEYQTQLANLGKKLDDDISRLGSYNEALGLVSKGTKDVKDTLSNSAITDPFGEMMVGMQAAVDKYDQATMDAVHKSLAAFGQLPKAYKMQVSEPMATTLKADADAYRAHWDHVIQLATQGGRILGATLGQMLAGQVVQWRDMARQVLEIVKQEVEAIIVAHALANPIGLLKAAGEIAAVEAVFSGAEAAIGTSGSAAGATAPGSAPSWGSVSTGVAGGWGDAWQPRGSGGGTPTAPPTYSGPLVSIHIAGNADKSTIDHAARSFEDAVYRAMPAVRDRERRTGRAA